MNKSLNINYKITTDRIPSINWEDVEVKDLYEYMDKKVSEGDYPFYRHVGSIFPRDKGYILKDFSNENNKNIKDLMGFDSKDSFKQKLDSKMQKICLNTRLEFVSIEAINEYINDDNKFIFVEEGLRDWNLEFKNGVYVSVDRSKKDISYFLEYYKFVEDCCRKDLSILDKSWVIIGSQSLGEIWGLISCVFKVNYSFIPTTLSSMISSSINGWGKVNVLGVDEKRIGTFYPANQIMICKDFLETLDAVYMYEGLLEGIRLAIVSGDKNEIEEILEFIKGYEEKREEYKFKNISEDLLEKIIRIKVGFVEKDPLEEGEKKLLGLGNSLASILNKINYSYRGKLSAGESLAVGLLWSFWVSKKLGYLSWDNYSYYIGVLKRSNCLLSYRDLCYKLDMSYKKEEGEYGLEDSDRIFSSVINEMILNEGLNKEGKKDKISMILLEEDGCSNEYIGIETIEKYWKEFIKDFDSIVKEIK